MNELMQVQVKNNKEGTQTEFSNLQLYDPLGLGLQFASVPPLAQKHHQGKENGDSW